MTTSIQQIEVTCPYCQKPAACVDSKAVYSRSYGMIWHCAPCKAWVGCHKNSKTNKPLGRLANAELRDWKKRAHAAFDPMWEAKMRRDGCTKGEARNAGYEWLAKQLGIPLAEMHIGMLDIDMCKRVVEVCKSKEDLSVWTSMDWPVEVMELMP